jgi:hypothetical protein
MEQKIKRKDYTFGVVFLLFIMYTARTRICVLIQLSGRRLVRLTCNFFQSTITNAQIFAPTDHLAVIHIFLHIPIGTLWQFSYYAYILVVFDLRSYCYLGSGLPLLLRQRRKERS